MRFCRADMYCRRLVVLARLAGIAGCVLAFRSGGMLRLEDLGTNKSQAQDCEEQSPKPVLLCAQSSHYARSRYQNHRVTV